MKQQHQELTALLWADLFFSFCVNFCKCKKVNVRICCEILVGFWSQNFVLSGRGQQQHWLVNHLCPSSSGAAGYFSFPDYQTQ
jgi:hypothetical protein